MGKDKRGVDCLLCAIIGGNKNVDVLEVFRDDLFVISVNLYPYTSGHLIIFPQRHLLDIRELTKKEVIRLYELMRTSMDIQDRLYHPSGYNIGFNLGTAGGASIPHIHMHVVPRYQKELGFVDILSGEKIIIEDPRVTMEKLRNEFGKGKAKE